MTEPIVYLNTGFVPASRAKLTGCLQTRALG